MGGGFQISWRNFEVYSQIDNTSVVNLRAGRTDNLVVAESEKCKGGLSTTCAMFHNVVLILYV